MVRISPLVLILSLLFSLSQISDSAAAETQITVPTADYRFGEQIVFQAYLRSSEPVQESFLVMQSGLNGSTRIEPASIEVMQDGSYHLKYILDLAKEPLRPFSTLVYHFEVKDGFGEQLRSVSQSLEYADNRFEWRGLEEEFIHVHWYEGDRRFAQSVMDTALAGLQRIQAILGLPNPGLVNIYIYSNAQTMQETLNLSNRKLLAGHADPEAGVIIAALPEGPEQQLLTEQRIPHELMHVMLYEWTGNGYDNLPTWLNEGLASIAELYPDPDYQILLDNAYQENKLLPISSLCREFPRDASNALLAYAQSADFTRYLYQTYGANGLVSVVEGYRDGLSCESGVLQKLGVDLGQLERGWRQVRYGESPIKASMKSLAPWLFLLLVILLTPLLLALGLRRKRPTG